MAYLVQCQEANPEYVAPRTGFPMNSILLKWLKKMKNIPLKKILSLTRFCLFVCFIVGIPDYFGWRVF